MTDYSKYEAIKTKKIMNDGQSSSFKEVFSIHEDKVNNAISGLLREGFEIIEIKPNEFPTDHNIYNVTNITYGKLKTPKK